MQKLKKWKDLSFSPLDLTLPIVLKLISDWHLLLKKLSPFASIVFILFNFKRLLVSLKPFITVALLIPALIIFPSFDIVRFMMSVCILWIFLEKLNDPQPDHSALLGWLVIFYVVAMTAGIADLSNYVIMDTKSMRYKFILESHNALTITAMICFVYLLNLFIDLEANRKEALLKWASYIAILLVMVVFLFIKSRIYTLMSFLLILILAIKQFRTSRSLSIATLIYLVLFFVITTAGDEARKLPLFYGNDATATTGDWNYMGGERMLSTDGTGRMKLINSFIATFREQGWKNFLYQNNVDEYYKIKAAIPGINMEASTLTENSYLVLLLYTGFLGLSVFLFIFANYLWRFYKRREYLSLSFMLLLLATWFFEETVLFPFSMITHLFALATVNRLETKRI